MRLDVESLKNQVSDQSKGGNGLSPPDNQGPQSKSGRSMYQERGGERVKGRLDEGLSRGEGGVEYAGGGESRSELLEVRRIEKICGSAVRELQSLHFPVITDYPSIM